MNMATKSMLSDLSDVKSIEANFVPIEVEIKKVETTAVVILSLFVQNVETVEKMVFRCCVPGCKTKANNGFHNFPANENVCLQWIRQTQTFHLDRSKLTNSYYKVCRLHFRESDFETNYFGQTRLAKNTVPSQLLPDPLEDNNNGSNFLESNSNEVNVLEINDADVEMDVTINNNNYQHQRSQVCSNEDNGFEINDDDDVMEVVDRNYWKDQCHSQASEKPKMKMYEEEYVKGLEKKLKYANIKIRNNKQTIESLQKLKPSELNDDKVLEYCSKFNKEQIVFFEMQLTNTGRKPHGQRYTSEQKSLCLAIYKQGPKCYRFLQKIFSLPDKRTLLRHSAYLMFETGIDPILFKFIKEKLKSLPAIDKYCIISWDEQSLKAHLDYSQSKDLIDGFVDSGTTREPKFATHALTFMVRGMNTPYKQTLAYFYTNALNAVELAEILQLVIEAALDTGLHVIGSVCDQVGSNAAAVNKLINPGCVRKPQTGEILKYRIRDKEIIHCFDPPHLIKVIRNNLMTKDLKHYLTKRWDISDSNNIIGKQKALVASWKDVSEIYEFNLRGTERPLKKITGEHIRPAKKKMRVSVATQVFSNTYGKFMTDCSKTKHFPRDLSGTAQILLFFNDLFDSINGSGHPQNGLLKGSINESSIHFVFWDYALEMLAKMNLINKETEEVNNRSTVLKKCMSTIRGYIEIITICFKANIKEVALRSTNQDGLENIFGCVKSCSQTVVSPISTQFRSGLTTTVINNLSSTNSMYTNCERDVSVPLLNNVHELIIEYKQNASNTDGKRIDDDSDSENEQQNILIDPLFSVRDVNFVEEKAISYESRDICRKLLQITNCQDCINTIHSTGSLAQINEDNFSFGDPTPTFTQKCKNLLCVINDTIPHLCSQKFLKRKILNHINILELDKIGCPQHETIVIQKLKELCVHFGIITFCQNINCILTGKFKSIPSYANNIEVLALSFKEKRRNIGKHSDIFQSK